MAIKDKNGNYIRPEIGRCYADASGFHISYLIQNSEEERIREKQRENTVAELSKKVDEYYRNLILELEAGVSALGLSLPKDEDKLNGELKEKQEESCRLFGDLEIIRRNIRARGEREVPKSFELFVSMGLPRDWFETAVPCPQNIREISSPYNRQRFDYETVYKELKKVFKDGFKDC